MTLPARPILPLLFLACLSLSGLARAATHTGTGFFITTDGHLATNFHVVASEGAITVRDHTGRLFDAKVVLRDIANDLAVLQVTGSSFTTLPIRASHEIRKGSTVFTLGFPNVSIQGRESKVTEGIISSLSGLAGEPNSFQISVPIQPGNSGGPLIDLTGAVVGLTTAKLSAASMLDRGKALPENVNYAVKSNYLLELLGTEKKIADAAAVSKANAKPKALTELVKVAEKATVLIRVEDFAQPARTEPDATQGPRQPRYVRDAQAIEHFLKGKAAFDRTDFKEALVSLGKAADLGHADAAYILGSMYANSRGVAKDEEEAARWFRKAAELGHANAQANLAFRYEQGLGVLKNDAESVNWYRKAAEQGNAFAQTNLGYRYESGRGISKDEAEGARWYRKAADQGNPVAQANLGSMYAKGRGVEKDDGEAVRWLRKSAEQGNADAQTNLGYLLEQGNGVTKDVTEAVRWYRKAADQGQAIALVNLGVMYANGIGVARDDEEAVRWYRKAIDKGNVNAQNNLGIMIQNGRGVKKDPVEAARWFRKAAEQGNAFAQANLAFAYEQGNGVEKNETEAHHWFRLAADQGLESARVALKRLGK